MLNIIMSIKRYFVFILTLMLSGTFVAAQDTFSIVAVDTITGEIGGAGASCIDESAIPGVC